MTTQPPPIYEELIDEDKKATVPWTLFFNQAFDGDFGAEWSPSFVSLATVGTPTITARYYKISKSLVYFAVRIVPATSTTATAGVTYIDTPPFTIAGDGACMAVSGLLGGSLGMVDSANNRIYVPSWSAITVPLTVVGLAEVR